MHNEYAQNLINGLKWLPIYEKAMEILEEFEKRNEHDMSYKMGLSDVLYYALTLFYDDIISHDGDSHELIKTIRDEFITAQEKNLRFIGGFGAMESQFKAMTDDMRNKKKFGEWKWEEK